MDQAADMTGETARSVRRERLGGALLIAIGAGAIIESSSYGFGSMRAIGSGVFPVGVGAVLVMLGLALVAGARAQIPGEHGTAQRPDRRALLCIVLGIASFALLAERAGLGPAAFVCTFVTCIGDRTVRLRTALLLAAALTCGGVLLFGVGLHIQLPILGGR